MLELWINDARHTPTDVEANTTLLEYLRNGLRLTGTKEGCASGDCGACTVVVGRLAASADTASGPDSAAAAVQYHTVNSCITPLAALHGMQVLTVDAVGSPEAPHPVQAAMVAHHASQCGFCTPGFVMSLVGAGLAAQPQSVPGHNSAHDLAPLIAGNLCRCTGYRSILDAATEAARSPAAPILSLVDVPGRLRAAAMSDASTALLPGYHRPQDEASLRALLRTDADARIVAGGTDLWLEVTQQYRQFKHVIDVSHVVELGQIAVGDKDIFIGGSVTHARLEGLFSPGGPLACAGIARMLARFASPQIRNRASLGGNLANGSPIADWPPVLMVLDARVEIGHASGQPTQIPINEFWRGYRATALGPGDYVRGIRFVPFDGASVHVFKISKRYEDDISTVLGAFRFEIAGGRIHTARIAFGGVAATPLRLSALEALIIDRTFDSCLTDAALKVAIEDCLALHVSPISDVRASASYRSAMVRALFERALVRAAETYAGSARSGAASTPNAVAPSPWSEDIHAVSASAG